jgi:hypothetical protein
MIADRIEGKVAQEPVVQVNNQMTLEMLVGASMRSVAEHKVPQIANYSPFNDSEEVRRSANRSAADPNYNPFKDDDDA